MNPVLGFEYHPLPSSVPDKTIPAQRVAFMVHYIFHEDALPTTPFRDEHRDGVVRHLRRVELFELKVHGRHGF